MCIFERFTAETMVDATEQTKKSKNIFNLAILSSIQQIIQI